jgi:AcrR family transcriptional regulator
MILTMKSNSYRAVAAIDADVVPAAAVDATPAPALHGRRWSGRRAPKRSRRDAILQSVGNVLRDSRLSSITMQDIAVELGITKGNLYYYFRDKQDILYQCHMRCMDLSLEALGEARAKLAAFAPGDSAHVCLRTLLMRHMLGILDHGFGNVLLTDLDNLSPPQRRRYISKRDEFESGVREMIEVGVAKGEFACRDVKLASLSMLGAINWIPKWYHQGGQMGSAQIAEGMADFLMRALEFRPARAREA